MRRLFKDATDLTIVRVQDTRKKKIVNLVMTSSNEIIPNWRENSDFCQLVQVPTSLLIPIDQGVHESKQVL